MTKAEATYDYLQKHGKITSWEAITECKNTRLSATICNLRKRGMTILSDRQHDIDSFGNKCNYVIYRLVKTA